MTADNLGAHTCSLGGFTESFTTLRNCRFCFITKADMQRKFDCQNLNMRTIQMHTEQVRLVENDYSLAPVYGIKGTSCLNELHNFHSMNGMPSDIAHDLFEGVVCKVMTNVIKVCVSKGIFDLEYLNDRILKFKFSEVDKSNKPSKVTKILRKLNIKQSAAQMWCFVRVLPLLVGSRVPVNNRIWECLLCLRDVLFMFGHQLLPENMFC